MQLDDRKLKAFTEPSHEMQSETITAYQGWEVIEKELHRKGIKPHHKRYKKTLDAYIALIENPLETEYIGINKGIKFTPEVFRTEPVKEKPPIASCVKCQRGFSTPSGLTKHFRSSH